MEMKHHSTRIITALFATLIMTANVYGQYAYSFSADAPSGQTLYYKITDSAQVAVVNPRTSNSDSNYVAGNLVIPETVSYCGTTYTVTSLSTHDFMMGTFYNCKTLTSVYVPNSVKTMGQYVFGYCSSLVSVHLPDSITSIPNMAFQGCTSLPSITIGRCVRNIFSDAFLHCYAISELHLLASVAPTVGYRALWSIPDTAKVFIPCGSTASYVSSSEWSGHFSIFIEEPGFVLDVTASDEGHGSVEIVSEPTCNNPQAELMATANSGYHFVRWSNGSTDNPLTITLNGDTSIVAWFAVDSFSVSVVSNDETMGLVSGGGVYAYGDTVTLTATANNGYHFKGWGVTPGYQSIITDNPLTLVATEEISAVAYFASDNTEDIDDIPSSDIRVYSLGGRIVVEGAVGVAVRVFDIVGRPVADHTLPAGLYFVCVGDRPARKVAVIR